MEVAALAPNLFRVGMFPDGRPPNYGTEAIAKDDWDPAGVEFREEDGTITLSTGAATARVGLDPLRVSFEDGGGAGSPRTTRISGWARSSAQGRTCLTSPSGAR